MSSNVDVMPETKAPRSEALRVANDATVVAPNTDVFLRFQGDPSQSISTASSWSYWYPTTGGAQIKLRLSFADAELKEADAVKIVSQEKQLGTSNVLGAFKDRRECYYYTDTQGEKQSWQVNAVSRRPDGKIHYGDQVLLTNLFFNNQQLLPDGAGYLTTTQNLNACWVIEKA